MRFPFLLYICAQDCCKNFFPHSYAALYLNYSKSFSFLVIQKKVSTIKWMQFMIFALTFEENLFFYFFLILLFELMERLLYATNTNCSLIRTFIGFQLYYKWLKSFIQVMELKMNAWAFLSNFQRRSMKCVENRPFMRVSPIFWPLIDQQANKNRVLLPHSTDSS